MPGRWLTIAAATSHAVHGWDGSQYPPAAGKRQHRCQNINQPGTAAGLLQGDALFYIDEQEADAGRGTGLCTVHQAANYHSVPDCADTDRLRYMGIAFACTGIRITAWI